MNFFSPLAVVSLILLHAASALGGPVVIFESGTLAPGETLDLDITIFDDDETGYSEFAFESFITQTAGSGQGLSFDISGPDFWLDPDYIFFEKTGTGSDGLPFVNVTSTLPDADDTYSVSDEAFPLEDVPFAFAGQTKLLATARVAASGFATPGDQFKINFSFVYPYRYDDSEPIPVDQLQSGTVTIIPLGPTPVPLPSSGALFLVLLGICGVGASARKVIERRLAARDIGRSRPYP